MSDIVPAILPAALDLGDLIGWLLGQWWVWLIVGVVVIGILVVWFMPAAKVKPNDAYSTTDTAANELALGYLQIENTLSGAWNDPTASGLTDKMKQHLIEQWGIADRAGWMANIERLMTDRRRRDEWVLCLAIRGELAQSLGRPPKAREWIAGIVNAGGSKGDARSFVTAVEYIEAETRKVVGKQVLGASEQVTTFDGYALGQAVAMTTWGVALGHTTVEEARDIIHRINDEARPAFSSWNAFGLSYVVGRVMHWSDGQVDEKNFSRWGDSARDFAAAASAKRNGPWAALPWSR